MRLILIAVFCLIAVVAPASDITPALRWFVDVERPAAKNHNLRRGETVDLQPTFRNYGEQMDLAGAHLVVLRYRATDATTTDYLIATGSVMSATSGVANVRWNSAMESSNSTYSYEIAVQATDSMLRRAYGTISLTPGIAVDGSTSSTPVEVTSIDWATVDNSNVGEAPFLSGFDTADLEAFDATLLDGTADLDVNSIEANSIVGPASGLSDWPDVVVTSVVNNGTSGLTGQVSRTAGAIFITFPTGGSGEGGSSSLAGLTDVAVTNVAQGQTLVYDEILGAWTNGVASGESSSTNRLTWVVGGETIGYVDTNGITMLKGSLQLFEEDLNCNVRAYDGSAAAPSVSFYASPSIGWYRKSIGGGYAWAYAHSSNDVLYLTKDGILGAGTNTVTFYKVKASSAFEANGNTGRTTNFTYITSVLTNGSGSVTGVVENALNFVGGILVP
jgi:hypothetical protein